MDLDEAAAAFQKFASIVQALRTPRTGCPWDLEQDHRSLRPFLVEEAYEVLDAIDRGDDSAFRDELGDLLLQVVLHSQVAADRGAFDITGVIRGIAAKMVRRHPHVFGAVQVSGAAEVVRNWEQIKAAENQGQGGASPVARMARLPKGLPALLRAQRVAEKAERAHFEAGSAAALLGKVREELARLEELIPSPGDGLPAMETDRPEDGRDAREEPPSRLEEGLGQVLFGLCQLARRLGLNAEDCLRSHTQRLVDHFRDTEEQLKP